MILLRGRQEQKEASAIADRKPENYWFRKIWLGFLILYPSIITGVVFYVVYLDGVGCIDIPIPVLVTLIGKTAATGVGVEALPPII